MDGCIYRTKDGECDLYAEGGKYTAFCDLENCNERKPSNADRIRAMTDEELAEQLYLLRLDALHLEGFEGFIETKDEVLDWLKEEAESEGEDGVN